MPKYPNISIMEDINGEDDTLDIIIRKLLIDFQHYLNIEPVIPNIKVIIIEDNFHSDNLENCDIFKIGVKKNILNNKLIIEVYRNYLKFLPFIVLREIYNNFIPKDLIYYESVQLVINQLLISDLSKHPLLNEWRELIRGHLKQSDQLSVGFNRLSEFDRLEKFFKLKSSEAFYSPSQFFFLYLRMSTSLINEKMDNFFNIIFEEYMNYISKSMYDDEIVETIRCLVEIFYDLKFYRNLISYRHYFQEFKEKGKINTELSLRMFIKNMEWIKKYSYIAPSYLLNWRAIDVCLISTSFRFNSHLEIAKIYKIINQLPFFIAPKIFRNGFTLDLGGYFVIPRVYLEDFHNFVKMLENNGYVINAYCLTFTKQSQNINLNYFREFARKHLIINPNHKNYDNKYEIEFKMDYGNKYYNTDLTIFDFVLLDRIRFFSTSGFGFERRRDTINTLKNDLLNEIISQRTLIRNLKTILNKFHGSVDLKTDFLRFLKKNKKSGFFFIKTLLEDLLSLLQIFDITLITKSDFENIFNFQEFAKTHFKSQTIEENILFHNLKILKTIYKEILPIYFRSKELYKNTVEKYNDFNVLINSCYNLKLFDLNAIIQILEDENLINTIYKTKDEKLKNSYEKYKLYRITNQEIENTLDKYLNTNPPLIQPILINTILFDKFEKQFIQLILRKSPQTQKILRKIKNFFPSFLIINTEELFLKKNLIIAEISIPFITKREKEQLFSIIFNNFKDNIIFGNFFLWSGMVRALSSKNFYDFDTTQFFYTKDLFKQFFLYVQQIFGDSLKTLPEKVNKSQEKFWSQKKSIQNFVERVNDNVLRKNYDFNIRNLNKLVEFHSILKDLLLDNEKFGRIQQNNCFKNYVKSIKFFPMFQHFGFGQYFLYLYPSDMNELDFKLLFTNTFQKVEYPACIDKSNSLFIKYIIPHAAPQLKYLHWLTKSKKVIREYCGFFIKKVYQILHFSHNLSSEGWVYDKDRFKMHMQSILFKTDYIFQIPEIKEYKIADEFISSYFGPDSPEFESLSNIYSWRSIDIKSFLRTKKATTVNHIINLLEKGLIFPYLSLKNLDLHDKVYIIIPNLKSELINTLIKIFSFFNYAFIYETEGEYFIYGFEQEKKYQNGLMIKIYFPKCEISEFMRLFDLLFEYLEIKDYLILNDLVDGKNLIKSIYGGLAFLNSYNPLKNLEWNEQDKIWQNPKIFTSKFEPIYPDLISKDK